MKNIIMILFAVFGLFVLSVEAEAQCFNQHRRTRSKEAKGKQRKMAGGSISKGDGSYLP